jgi:2-isopropylmalate synthase
MEKQMIHIFDTTLRDGEQSPGASLSIQDKITVAHQLARLRVDVIEAGFPVSSEVQFQAVKRIGQEVNGPTIAALARCVPVDIERAAQALETAAKPRIHTFAATSKIHLEKKFRKSEADILDMSIKGIEKARQYVDEVEFSPEDSSRTGKEFLFQIVEEAIRAGARVINIPDTVGYSNPSEFGDLITEIRSRVPNIENAILSVHCHNDLGLATANTLSAIQAGAQQVEVTVNGVGERAGNASLEEVVMALKTRADIYNAVTNIDTREITSSSRMISRLMGMPIQPNKAIVGANAFAHESGIHQDAVIKDSSTYEIMTPADVGLDSNQIVLGRHSGRHGLKKRLQDLGYQLSEDELNRVYDRFLDVADKKKEIFEEDLLALIAGEGGVQDIWTLNYFHILSGNKAVPTATISLKYEGKDYQEAAVGDGPVDAAYKAIDKIVQSSVRLVDYALHGVTGGKDAMGEVIVRVEQDHRQYLGRGASTDVIEASIMAYVNALNRVFTTMANEKEKALQ